MRSPDSNFAKIAPRSLSLRSNGTCDHYWRQQRTEFHCSIVVPFITLEVGRRPDSERAIFASLTRNVLSPSIARFGAEQKEANKQARWNPPCEFHRREPNHTKRWCVAIAVLSLSHHMPYGSEQRVRKETQLRCMRRSLSRVNGVCVNPIIRRVDARESALIWRLNNNQRSTLIPRQSVIIYIYCCPAPQHRTLLGMRIRTVWIHISKALLYHRTFMMIDDKLKIFRWKDTESVGYSVVTEDSQIHIEHLHCPSWCDSLKHTEWNPRSHAFNCSLLPCSPRFRSNAMLLMFAVPFTDARVFVK